MRCASRFFGCSWVWGVDGGVGPVFGHQRHLEERGHPRQDGQRHRDSVQNGEAFDQIDVDRNGKYFLDVPLRSDYLIEFSAPDMVTKRVQIDGAAVPRVS